MDIVLNAVAMRHMGRLNGNTRLEGQYWDDIQWLLNAPGNKGPSPDACAAIFTRETLEQWNKEGEITDKTFHRMEDDMEVWMNSEINTRAVDILKHMSTKSGGGEDAEVVKTMKLLFENHEDD